MVADRSLTLTLTLTLTLALTLALTLTLTLTYQPVHSEWPMVADRSRTRCPMRPIRAGIDSPRLTLTVTLTLTLNRNCNRNPP